jgi:hypothetical protein
MFSWNSTHSPRTQTKSRDPTYPPGTGAEGFLSRTQEVRAGWQEGHKEAKSKARDQVVKDYITKHDTLDGFDMDKDYTKDYPQEDVLRGLEETVQTVESTFHTGYVWTVWVDLVCDCHYCLYDSLYLFCLCLYCKMHLRCVLNDVSPYNAVK